MQMNLFNKSVTNAKPFMKWVGGKRQLIPDIESRLPPTILKTKEIDNYFEPFIGGGALFFYLMNNYNVKKAYISDVNKELVLTYEVIKNDHKSLIDELQRLEQEYLSLDSDKRKTYYNNIRTKFNNDLNTFDFSVYDEETIIRASYTLFMNKTCFNGLFRLNKKGEFNVPQGKYKNPMICDKENIIEVHNVLKNVTIKNDSYLASEEFIDNKSLVYLDPPYRPISKTANFTSYSDNDFNDDDQIELSNYFKRISQKGAYAILSNSDPHNGDPDDNFFDDLYKEFTIERILAKRSINSNGNKRGPINELLIRNY